MSQRFLSHKLEIIYMFAWSNLVDFSFQLGDIQRFRNIRIYFKIRIYPKYICFAHVFFCSSLKFFSISLCEVFLGEFFHLLFWSSLAKRVNQSDLRTRPHGWKLNQWTLPTVSSSAAIAKDYRMLLYLFSVAPKTDFFLTLILSYFYRLIGKNRSNLWKF